MLLKSEDLSLDLPFPPPWWRPTLDFSASLNLNRYSPVAMVAGKSLSSPER